VTNRIEAALALLRQGLSGGSRSQVNEAARELLALGAPLRQHWQPVSAALAHNGEVTLALKAMDQLVLAAGGSALTRYLRAALLAQSGRVDRADAEIRALPGDVPDPASNAYLRGTIALNRGDRQGAADQLRRAVALSPGSGQAWLALSEVADFRADPQLGRQLEDAWRATPAQAADHAQLAYAVGRMRHQLGLYQAAFEAFSAGAEARRLQQDPLDAADAAEPWPRELIDEARTRITTDHSRAIFVTGLPRSGTTLVEQILASHPEVAAGEELGFFRILAEEIGGVDAGSFRRWMDRGGDPNALTALYLHLASERLGTQGRFVDKTVEAGNYMSLLLSLFPNAPIFWMRRDPIDNGWSSFRTYFAQGAEWSWRLEDIGRRLALEDSLLQHWTREGAGQITMVDYAALVQDPEDGIGRIAAAAGLTADERMFRPHETKRTVATASVSQVREPINLEGLGASDPYREWLGPMIDAYRGAAVSAGSSALG
jgi:tetratricopeptide (TPR) repeat protein